MELFDTNGKFAKGHKVVGGFKTRFKKGQKFSQEYRKKLSDAGKGKVHKWTKKVISCVGYKYLWKPDNPMSNKLGYLAEHRYIMSEAIGRILTTNDVVHHINGKKDDNRIENLALTDKVSHQDFHKGKVTCPYCHKIYIVKSIGK